MEPSKIMAKGKIGLFSMIESAANLRNSKVLFAMTLVLLGISVLLHFTVPEIAAIPYFMAFSAVMVLVSIAELVLIRRKKGVMASSRKAGRCARRFGHAFFSPIASFTAL